uniref:Globin family profile domain-containing protein n=1 Tax=Acrobeloides nanus TaxID=290746 RepID=A0A914DMB1_9BILA
MVLSAEDRKLVQATWCKVAPHLDDLGGEALSRLFLCYPQTKTYFPHFNLSADSKDVHQHGLKVAKALDGAIKHLDNIRGNLAYLSDLHAYNLRVDPVNFELLAKCFHVVLAIHLGKDYSPTVILAWDKFFHCVGDVLCEKYR